MVLSHQWDGSNWVDSFWFLWITKDCGWGWIADQARNDDAGGDSGDDTGTPVLTGV